MFSELQYQLKNETKCLYYLCQSENASMLPESRSLGSIFKEGSLLYSHPDTVEVVLRCSHAIALFCRMESCFTRKDDVRLIEKFLLFSF